MPRHLIVLLSLTFALVVPLRADIALFDWAFNVNGTLYEHFGGNVPPAYSGSFDWSTGLGTIQILMPGAGSRYFAAFFDHEIDVTLAGAQFDEYGTVVGTPATGQTWEIDEPGWAAGYVPPGPIWGDIYSHVVASPPSLENLNSVPVTTPYDVSIALGWSFITPAGQDALVTLRLANTAPTSGLYLVHNDAGNSSEKVFFSSDVAFQTTSVPEPDSWALLVTMMALLGAGAWRKHRAG